MMSTRRPPGRPHRRHPKLTSARPAPATFVYGTVGCLLMASAGLTASSAPRSHPAASARPLAAPVAATPVAVTPVPPTLRAQATGATVGTSPALRAVSRKGRAPALADIRATSLSPLVLRAYRAAEARLTAEQPACHLSWTLLAAIGRVETDNGADVPPGGGISAGGTISPPILGPALDGTGGFAAIRDGASWARAIGPFQFIPSTWSAWGTDGNGDHIADPDNVFDASLAAARYLCAGGGDLTDAPDIARAAFSYNHSRAYAALVVLLYAAYAHEDAARLTAAAELSSLPPDPVADPLGAPDTTVTSRAGPGGRPTGRPAPGAGTPSPDPSAPGPTRAGPTPPSRVVTTAPSPTPQPSTAPTAPPEPTDHFDETLTRRGADFSITGDDTVGAGGGAVIERWIFTLTPSAKGAPTLVADSPAPGWRTVGSTTSGGQTVITVELQATSGTEGGDISVGPLALAIHGGELVRAEHVLVVTPSGGSARTADGAADIVDGIQQLTGSTG